MGLLDGQDQVSATQSLGSYLLLSSLVHSGVNLGGWLVLEPFIVPALFDSYNNVRTSSIS